MTKRNLKKMAAFAMAAAMVVSTPVGAADQVIQGSGTVSGTSNPVYYKQNITNVTVPTSLAVAFNPEELDVDLGAEGISKAQIVSRTVAMVSTASRDKKVTVSFGIATNNEKIKFVDKSKVNEGTDLNVNLRLLAAAETGNIKAGSGVSGTVAIAKSGTGLNVTSEQLAKAVMSGAPSGTERVITSGTEVSFRLEKAKYDYPTLHVDNTGSGSEVVGTLNSLAAGDKGITAFKFVGEMNPNADWSTLGNETDTKITITPTYTVVDATAAEMEATAVDSGTGALLPAGVSVSEKAPSIATKSYAMVADTPVEITVDLGSGDLAATKVSKLMDGDQDAIALGYASYANGKVTLIKELVNAYRGQAGSSKELKVVFDDESKTEITITLNK